LVPLRTELERTMSRIEHAAQGPTLAATRPTALINTTPRLRSWRLARRVPVKTHSRPAVQGPTGFRSFGHRVSIPYHMKSFHHIIVSPREPAHARLVRLVLSAGE